MKIRKFRVAESAQIARTVLLGNREKERHLMRQKLILNDETLYDSSTDVNLTGIPINPLTYARGIPIWITARPYFPEREGNFKFNILHYLYHTQEIIDADFIPKKFV